MEDLEGKILQEASQLTEGIIINQTSRRMLGSTSKSQNT